MSSSSDHNIHGHHRHNQYPAAKKSLQIKQDDKFFSRLMSKETSMANSSCRVYYGEASGAVPFTWESQPGTPKHPFSDTSTNPPLTPPPSYSASSTATSKSESMQNKISKTKFFANTIFFPKKTRVKSSSVSSLSTSSSSSSWSSSNSSASSLTNQKGSKPCRRRRSFSGSGIPFDVYDYDEHEPDHESPTSTLSCFSMINSKQRKCNNGANSVGCYSIWNLKNAF